MRYILLPLLVSTRDEVGYHYSYMKLAYHTELEFLRWRIIVLCLDCLLHRRHPVPPSTHNICIGTISDRL